MTQPASAYVPGCTPPHVHPLAAAGLAGDMDGSCGQKKKKKQKRQQLQQLPPEDDGDAARAKKRRKKDRQAGKDRPQPATAATLQPARRQRAPAPAMGALPGRDAAVAAITVGCGPAAGGRLTGLAAPQLEAACGLLESHGVVALGPAVLPAELLARLAGAAARLSGEVQAELRARGIPFEAAAGAGGPAAAASRALERNHSFKFHEVASRCLGRLDIRHRTDAAPFDDPLLVSNPVKQSQRLQL